MAQSNSFTVKTADEVRDMLDFLHAKLDCCLVIDGESLQVRDQCIHPMINADEHLSCVWTSSEPSLSYWRLSFRSWWPVDAAQRKRRMSPG